MPPGHANADTDAALRYHEQSSHTEARLRRVPHQLDWDNQPLPFKIYRGVESVPLPADPAILSGSTAPALDAIAASPRGRDRPSGDVVPDLYVLTRLLYLSAGITKRKRLPGGREMYFRAYPNTGALYHVDVYLVCAELPDLPAGVYHFGPEDFALHRLRSGDHREHLVQATGAHPRVTRAPVVLVTASTYWRNAWKYRERAYRHCFWDAGTLHANLLGAAAGAEADADDALAPTVVMGFADRAVEALLGLDAAREGALTLVPVGWTGGDPPPAPPLAPLDLATEPLSRREVDYPLIRETHEASALEDGEAAAAWRVSAAQHTAEPAEGPEAGASGPGRVPVTPGPAGPEPSLAHVIRRRGSTRAFDPAASIPFQALSTALVRATGGVPADFLQPPGTTLLTLYLIVNSVEGLVPGTYRYHRRERTLELLAKGDFRRQAGRLALGQQLAADAAVNVYSVCDLPGVLERLGNRGYRAAQLEGGITGGRLYLAAYAQGLGATGLTFFDDEVIELFSPHAAGQSVMFLAALGRADRVALRQGRR